VTTAGKPPGFTSFTSSWRSSGQMSDVPGLSAASPPRPTVCARSSSLCQETPQHVRRFLRTLHSALCTLHPAKCGVASSCLGVCAREASATPRRLLAPRERRSAVPWKSSDAHARVRDFHRIPTTHGGFLRLVTVVGSLQLAAAHRFPGDWPWGKMRALHDPAVHQWPLSPIGINEPSHAPDCKR
jgi:hypothetical protein